MTGMQFIMTDQISVHQNDVMVVAKLQYADSIFTPEDSVDKTIHGEITYQLVRVRWYERQI